MARSPERGASDRVIRTDRRRFLASSLLGTGALVTGVGCGASIPRVGGPWDARRAEELAERLDRGLARVRDVPRGEFARHMRWQSRPELSERVLRLTLESLVVADVARAVPSDVAVPAALATRLSREMPVIERSTMTHHSLLRRMPPAARRGVDAQVREQPDLPLEVAGWIDRHAAQLGADPSSRVKLREAARDVKVRILRQSTSALIDDCVAKVDRAVERSAEERIAARSSRREALADAIWGRAGGSSDPAILAPSRGIEDELGDPGQAPAQEPIEPTPEFQPWNRSWDRPGDREIEIGAILMPFGLITCGALLLVGLTMVIVGSVENSTWDGTPEQRDD